MRHHKVVMIEITDLIFTFIALLICLCEFTFSVQTISRSQVKGRKGRADLKVSWPIEGQVIIDMVSSNISLSWCNLGNIFPSMIVLHARHGTMQTSVDHNISQTLTSRNKVLLPKLSLWINNVSNYKKYNPKTKWHIAQSSYFHTKYAQMYIKSTNNFS